MYRQSGKYHNLKGEEGKYGWKFLFLCDIENAWSAFLLNDLIRQLKTQGFVQFKSESYLTSKQIEIGSNYLKCNDMKFNKWEIKEVSSHQGMLFIDHINYESKYLGFKTKGDRMVIPINDMPNKKAFLTLLNNLL